MPTAIKKDFHVKKGVEAPSLKIGTQEVTSLLDSMGYNAQSYCMSMYYGKDWPDEGNICARGGGDKG